VTEVILKNITKRFKDVTAINDVSFEIADGEFFVLLGPTGAGKTTTLRLIAGLEKLDGGEILFDGQAIDAGGARCGYGFSTILTVSEHDRL
jgi:multiple sugar transport system ATP-binding protein